MDIVYANKASFTGDSEELRYSLRSLSNLPHDDVFIAGEIPSWVMGITHINVIQEPDVPGGNAKQVNISRNISSACRDPRVSENFIYMNNDFFIIKPQRTDISTSHQGTMATVAANQIKRFGLTPYFEAMLLAAAELMRRGIPEPKSYELHTPFVVNKQKYLDLLDEFADILWQSPSCLSQWRSLYGNHYDIGGDYMDDVKAYEESAGLDIGHIEDLSFLSSTAESFRHSGVGKFVKERFAHISEYEDRPPGSRS